jgi:mannose/fructose/N-acetylgalactosamine-specific phosphotransferase system component IIC
MPLNKRYMYVVIVSAIICFNFSWQISMVIVGLSVVGWGIATLIYNSKKNNDSTKNSTKK